MLLVCVIVAVSMAIIESDSMQLALCRDPHRAGYSAHLVVVVVMCTSVI